MMLRGFILLGSEWHDLGPFIDDANALDWVKAAGDALGTHIMAWPFFAMDGAALLGDFKPRELRIWPCFKCGMQNYDECSHCEHCGVRRGENI